MKKQMFVILLLLFNILIVFIPMDIVKADTSGGNIDGDTIWWENEYANMSAYPATSDELINHWHLINMTWLYSDQTIDVAFRFNESQEFLSGHVFKWDGDSWQDVPLTETTYNNKKYYVYTAWNVVQDTEYKFKFLYNMTANSTGKWDLMAKLSSDSISEALSSGRYVMLDPWWSTDWYYRVGIYIDHDAVPATVSNFPLLVNLSGSADLIANAQANGWDLRFVHQDNQSEFYYHHAESWSTYHKTWVQVPNIYDTNETYFNCYYGNPTATRSAYYDSDTVWRSDYVAVFYGNSTKDMSGNQYDFINVGSVGSVAATDGNGEAYQFQGTPDAFIMMDGVRDSAMFNQGGFFCSYISADAGDLYLSSYNSSDGGDVIGTYKSAAGDLISTVDDDTVSQYSETQAIVGITNMTLLSFQFDSTVNGMMWVDPAAVAFVDVSGIGSPPAENDGRLFFGENSISGDNHLVGFVDMIVYLQDDLSASEMSLWGHNIKGGAGIVSVGSEVVGITGQPTDKTDTTTTLNGVMIDLGTDEYDAGFIIGVTSPVDKDNADQNVTCPDTHQTGEVFEYNITGLTAGELYYIKAWVNDSSDEWTYGVEVDMFTHPSNASNFISSQLTNSVQLDWTHGAEYDKSVLVRNNTGVASYPTHPDDSDGTVIYNGTDSTYEDATVTQFSTYYYSLWEYAAEGGYGEHSLAAQNTAISYKDYIVVINETTNITGTDASINAYFTGGGLDGNYDYGFWYGTTTPVIEGSYAINTTIGTGTNDVEYSLDLTDLNLSTTYYIKAWFTNSTFWLVSAGDSFRTNREPVVSAVVPINGSVSDVGIDISLSIADPDGDTFNYTIEVDPSVTVSGQPVGGSSENIQTNGTQTLTINVSHNVTYTWYLNVTDSYGWANSNYSFTSRVLYVDLPTNGSSHYHETVQYLYLSWMQMDRADNYIVVQNNNTYPTDCINGSGNWVRQNDSNNEYNISWGDTSGGYFTIYSWNSTGNMYSQNHSDRQGLDIPWGALSLSCFNESDGSQALTFDIEVSNSDFTTTYEATDLTNIHYLDMEDIPYGTGTIFQVSSEGYETRTCTYDIFQNNFYNLVFYLPLALPTDPDENIIYAEDYVIHVAGPQSEYGVDPPIEDAEVIIRKYINTTEQYGTVGVYITSADGTFTVPLLPNNRYSFNLSATGYYDEVESWKPVEIVFEGDRHHTFRLTPTTTPEDEYTNFWNTITFTRTMNDIDGVNGTITITYDDSNLSTIDTQIYIYEYWNGIETLIATISNVSTNSFTYTTGVINTTRQHSATLFFNNTANFDVNSPVTIIINNINIWGERTKFDFEERVKSIFGEAGFTYAAAVAAFLAIMALVMFGPHNTGIGILACGFTLGITSALFIMLFTGGFDAGLTIYIPIIIIVGAMYVLIKHPGGHL